jgi:esterase
VRSSETQADYRSYLGALCHAKGIHGCDLSLPRNSTVDLDGMNFHFLDWGNPRNAPILFLHGGAQTCHTWDLCCLLLQNWYRCLALDQRGHGDSDWAIDRRYSIEDHRRDIERIVDHIGLSQFAVVGMSMGGINALAYAASHSERLLGLILVDVGPEVQYRGAARTIQSVVKGRAEFRDLDDAMNTFMQKNPNHDPRVLKGFLMQSLREVPTGGWQWKYDRQIFEELTIDQLLEERKPLWNELSRITCPVLIARGARSSVFLDEDAEHLAQAMPLGEWVRIEDAGHSIQTDNPPGLTSAIDQFLKRCLRSKEPIDGAATR